MQEELLPTTPDVDSTEVLVRLSRASRRWAETEDLDATLHDLVYTCCRIVPCHSAAVGLTSSVPTGRPVELRAASNPDEFSVLLDIVSTVQSSPGVAAAAGMTTIVCPDLETESRPELRDFARLTVERTVIRATVAFALHLRGRLVGVLNLYFADRHDLHERAAEHAAAVADHAAIVFGRREVEERADGLAMALQSSRTIGAALGILVERYRVTEDAAFEILRTVSQQQNRKLFAVAENLVRTGSIAR